VSEKLEPKSSFIKKRYKPGMHKRNKSYTTFFGKLMLQKQRLKAFYRNLKDYQLFNLIKKNISFNNYQERIIKHLESRVDTIMFRSGLFVSVNLVRQLINHRHIKVDDVTVKSPSLILKHGQVISLSETGLAILKRNETKTIRKIPDHIIVNLKEHKIVFNEQFVPKNDNELFFANHISLNDVIRSYRL